MELILAILIGFLIFCRWINQQHRNARSTRYDALYRVVGIDFKTCVEIQKKLSDKESRERCFDAIDSDMKYILGDDWRSEFDSYKSDYTFQHSLGLDGALLDYRFQKLENIVYYLMMAREGHAPHSFDLYNIGGFSIEESYGIIKRTCVVIERLMKDNHKGLEHELDMYICKLGGREVITFWYHVAYVKLNNYRKLNM